ncbi:MAG: hypothetical protein A2X08_06440 [Bacteroidetes bacterium GWA2_32_17]|nr:MAG: hypothetical protein A2X08_06440 [Bacteroidetes bacterium GWA2_32_17]
MFLKPENVSFRVFLFFEEYFYKKFESTQENVIAGLTRHLLKFLFLWNEIAVFILTINKFAKQYLFRDSHTNSIFIFLFHRDIFYDFRL